MIYHFEIRLNYLITKKYHCCKKPKMEMCHFDYSWWRHQMETFSALLANCAGNSTVPGEFPAQKPVTQSFDVFCLRLNKRLSKQSRGWWFETASRSLWRHCKNSFSSLSRGQTNVKVKIPNDYHICIIRQIYITLHHDLSFWNKIYLKFSQKYLSCKKNQVCPLKPDQWFGSARVN